MAAIPRTELMNSGVVVMEDHSLETERGTAYKN